MSPASMFRIVMFSMQCGGEKRAQLGHRWLLSEGSASTSTSSQAGTAQQTSPVTPRERLRSIYFFLAALVCCGCAIRFSRQLAGLSGSLKRAVSIPFGP